MAQHWLSSLVLALAVLETANPACAQSQWNHLGEHSEFAAKCVRYNALIEESKWRTVYHETFAKSDEPSWALYGFRWRSRGGDQPAPRLPKLECAIDEGRDVLVFDASQLSRGQIRIGPAVSNEFAIEVTMKSMSEAPSDLNILTNDVPSDGPAFQFGSRSNTRNVLWCSSAEEAGVPSKRVLYLPPEPQVVARQWHRVRLEMRDGWASAHVDGRVVGRLTIVEGYDRELPRQPMIQTRTNAIAIDDARTQVPAEPSENAARDVWSMVFGETSVEDVHASIDGVIECLGDSDPLVRKDAEDALARMGLLAEKPLQRAAENAMPEIRRRSSELLIEIQPPKPPGSAAPVEKSKS